MRSIFDPNFIKTDKSVNNLIKKNMKFSLFSFLMLICSISNATNFYVDPSSTASTQTGTLAAPWKTLSQVQSKMNTFNPGDFIYFKKGQVFTGTLEISRSGTATAPITFSSYGSDTTMPVFTGAAASTIHVSYQQYIVIDGIKITDFTMNPDDHTAEANIKLAIYIDGSSYTTVKNCDISLVGGGVNIQGSNNTVDRTTIQNMRMIVNTPGGDDDYGAIPIIISGSNNIITNNFFKDGYGASYDYTYDGGAIEVYGVLNSNNKIMYNTAIDCDGFMEIGYDNGGNSDSNMVAYNKIINCGELVYISNSGSWATSVVNLKFFNNVIVSTANLLRMPNTMIGMSSSSTVSNIINLKNNIFWLTAGIDVASPGKFTGTQMTHEDNIYHLGTNSVLNYTANTSELSTLVALFTNTTSSDPVQWDYHPIAGCPAIDFGQNLGIQKDFAGNTVPAVPNAGILEGLASQATLAVSPTAGTINCNGGTTTVTIAASGGTAPYTGTGTFTVGAGTYTYTITDAAGTVKTASVTITQPAAIAVSAAAQAILVFGGSTSVTVTTTGGTSPYTYSINAGAFQTSNIFLNILAGSQTITVKDGKGCTSVQTISITQPAVPTQLTAYSNPAGSISCNGGSTTVTVSAAGGTAPYTGTGNFTKTAGTYTFTITDAAGTVKTTSITITQPTLLTASATAGTITIYGGVTSIIATATGGTSSYTYSLNGGSFQSGNTFSNVATGTQTITVKDANGCTAVKTLTITQPTLLVVSSTQGTISCNGGTATVAVSATGGTAPYTGTGSFTKAAGTYTFSVTDAGGAVKTTSITITEPTAITASVVAPGVYSATAKTTATVTAGGGTPGYTYSLDAGTYQSSNVFSNVAVGTHSLKVKDSRGCINTSVFTVVLLPLSPLAITTKNGFMTCYGGTSTITVTASGGIPPYTGTGVFTNAAGVYTFTVTDASGVTATATTTLVQPHQIVPTIATGTIAVNGGSTTATITTTGGTGPYSYQLNSGVYQPAGTFSNIIAGTYTVTVMDSKGCAVTKSFTVTQPAPVFHITLVSKTDVTCSGNNNGSIKAAGASGTSPYTYKKDNGGYSSNNTFNNLAPATYTITCKDATGLTSSMSVTIASSNIACRTTGKGTGGETVTAKTDDLSMVKGLEVIAFPNPTNSQFSLIAKSNNEENIHFIVMNMNGQKVYENNSIINKQNIFGNSFVPGIYFVKVVQGNRVQIIKLIKSK